MTALSAPADRPWRAGDQLTLGVAATTRIWQGGIVEIAGGYAQSATAGAGKRYYGVALTTADNRTGAAGDVTVTVRRRGAVYMQVTAGDKPVIGDLAYIIDDSTVAATAGGRSALGRTIGADDDGVWVDQEVVT